MACLLVLAMCITGCGKKEEPNTPANEVKESVDSTELEDDKTPLGNVEIESEEATEDEEASGVIEEVEEAVEEEVEVEVDEEGLVLEDGTTLLFEGGQPDEGFSTEDVEWFLTAPDDAIFTVVYSCNDASHVDWGVAGFIAVVEGVEMKGPELYAHKEDATKKVYITCSVKDLKECLQITEGKIVGNFMLGAWNGGQISELYITTDGKLPEVKDAEEVEFRKKVAVDTSDLKPSDMTGNYMFVYTDLVTIDFRTDKYCPGYVVGDTILVEVEMESDGGFLGCFGTCVGSEYAWHMEEYKSEVGEPITAKFEITPSIDTLQFQTWWMGGTKVGISSVSITTVGKSTASAPAPAPAPVPSYPSGGGTNVNPGQGNTGTTDNGVVRNYTDVLTASQAVQTGHMASAATVSAWETALTIRSPKEGAILDAAALNDDNYFVVEYVGESAPVFQIPKGETTIVVTPCDTSVAGYAVYSFADMEVACGGTLADVNLVLANASDTAITVNSMKLVSAVETTSEVLACELDAVEYNELITRSGKVFITEPVTCEPEMAAYTLFDPDKNSFLDLTQVNDKNFHLVVEYTTAYPPGLAIGGPKNSWAKVAPCHVENGKAVFSYAEMVAAYGSLEDVAFLTVWNKTDRGNLTVTEVKTLDVEVPVDTTAVDDVIYRGSAEGRGWEDDNYMTLAASHFAGLAFDGSKKLVITYVSTYTNQDTMFQLASGDYGIVYDSGINAGKQSNFAVKEFVLTEKYDSMAEKGLIVHGCNWTITKIMIDDVETTPDSGEGNQPEGGGTPEGGEGQKPEGGETNPLTGSVVLNDISWWTQVNVDKDRLLCGQELEKIEKITFSSTGNFVIAYNNLDGCGTITEYNKDPYWSQIEGASSYELDLDNVNFETYNFIIALSNNEGVDYTITWEVVLKDDQSGQPEGGDQDGNEGGEDGNQPQPSQPGSVTLATDAWWAQQNLSVEELTKGMAIEEIDYVRFTGNTDFILIYNNTDGSGIVTDQNPSEWCTRLEGATSYDVSLSNMKFDDYNFVVAISKNDGVEYTITWEVVLKDDQPSQPEGGEGQEPEGGEGQQPESGDQSGVQGGNEDGEGGNEGGEDSDQPQPNPTGFVYFEVAQGWIEKAVTKEQLLCGLDPAEVLGFRFSGPVHIYVGFNGASGGWIEYKEQTSHEIAIEEIAMDGFGMNLALWNENAEHTITWEVIKK